MLEHTNECRWAMTTDAECEYRATHYYCPHLEHACNCTPAIAVARNPKIKVLVRTNLKMSLGKTAAQALHAGVGLYKKYKLDHYKCVVLEVSDKKFNEAKLEHPNCYVVTDGGFTEVPAGTETCLAFYEEQHDDRRPSNDAPSV